MKESKYYVYILYSESIEQYYKGQTNDIEDRMVRHNGGRNEYTKRGVPWTLVWCIEKATRSEAMQLEKILKKYGQKSLEGFMERYSEHIVERVW